MKWLRRSFVVITVLAAGAAAALYGIALRSERPALRVGDRLPVSGRSDSAAPSKSKRDAAPALRLASAASKP